MNVWRLRPSGGSPEQLTTQHAAVNFLAPLDTRTLLYVARAEDWSGPWLWALDVERKVTRRVPSGVDQYTSVSASRDGRRIVATVANPSASLWRVPLLDRLADDRDAQPYPLPVPTGGRWRRASAGRRCSICPPAGRATGSGGSRTDRRPKSGEGVDGALSEPPAVSPDGQPRGRRRQTRGETAPVDHVGGRHERTAVGPVHRNRRGVRPGHGGLVAGRDMDRDGRPRRAGSGVVQDPRGRSGAPVRLVAGQAVNPVWSPNGNLIVYAGRSVVGQVATPWRATG